MAMSFSTPVAIVLGGLIAGEQGAQRSVVVERRVIRRFGNDKRTGT